MALSLELPRECVKASRAGQLTPASRDHLSVVDTRSIIAAKRMVDERWREKPPLNVSTR